MSDLPPSLPEFPSWPKGFRKCKAPHLSHACERPGCVQYEAIIEAKGMREIHQNS